MKPVLRFVFLFLLALVLKFANAEVISSIQNGFWQNPTTWSSNTVPQPTDTVLVDHYVQIIDTVFIDPAGQLTIDSCGTLCGDNCLNGHFTNYGNMYIGCFILNAPSYNYDSILSNNTGGTGVVAGGFMQSYGYINVGPNMPPCVLPINKKEAVGNCQRVATGIKENSASINFSIYPNPANTEITLTCIAETSYIKTIALYNVTGQRMRLVKADINTFNYTMNVSDIPAGFYWLQVSVGELIATKRFVIER